MVEKERSRDPFTNNELEIGMTLVAIILIVMVTLGSRVDLGWLF